jgi:hypothetical protein
MYFYEINKLIIYLFSFTLGLFLLLAPVGEFIFHNKQNFPTKGYMLNVYVFVGF